RDVELPQLWGVDERGVLAIAGEPESFPGRGCGRAHNAAAGIGHVEDANREVQIVNHWCLPFRPLMMVRRAPGPSGPCRPAAAAAWVSRRIAVASEITRRPTSSRALHAAQNKRSLRSPFTELATKCANGSRSSAFASRTNACFVAGGGTSI